MKMRQCLLAILVTAGLLNNVSAASYGPDLFAQSKAAGKAQDRIRALPMTSFYSQQAAPGAAGKLVAAEPFTGYELPAGVTAIRILYHSRTAHEQDVLVSGVVLIPYGAPPPGGWPVLAWSHGTSGVARTCAPSLMTSLYYNWAGLYEYVSLGYAVVATDYAGLGGPGRHAYIDMESNGADVVYSVEAARAAAPTLGPRWIAVGHSQGGLSVLGVAQLQARLRDPNFLGTVSLAGASDLEDGVKSMQAFGQPILNGLMGFIVFGAQTVQPTMQATQVLSDRAASIYASNVEDGCRAASAAFAAIPTAEMYRTDWNRDAAMKKFLERNRPGAQPTQGPVFLVTGGSDILFTPQAADKIKQRLCAQGLSVQWQVYPGLGHDEVVLGSLNDQMDWIAARFAGSPAPSTCSIKQLR